MDEQMDEIIAHWLNKILFENKCKLKKVKENKNKKNPQNYGTISLILQHPVLFVVQSLTLLRAFSWQIY